jgi:PBP1b-binding outer membrane lipoprotein LpoB
MMVRRAVMVTLLCIFIADCGKNTSDDMKAKVENVKDKAKDTAENVWSGQVKAIDKAKGIGKSLMDAAEDQRHKIDKESE